VDGRGFRLTSAQDGVSFDMDGDGTPRRTGWTAARSTNAFLVLDRNHNGLIDNGTELFGDHTSQPASDHPNGFLALAQFDLPENGGNLDGVIDPHDAVFATLRLWVDANHNGISEKIELFDLPELGIHSISVEEVQSLAKKDRFGNLFRYRAEINDGILKVSRWAYDVFLVTEEGR